MNSDLPLPISRHEGGADFAFWILAVALFVLGVLAYLTLHIDHPFLIATNSRALYVDEGFYSDAAQNFTKFGRWGFPYDFPHWAGAPVLALLQSMAFLVFGADLETARLLSVVVSLVTALAFYAIVRTSLAPAAAVMLTLAGVLTINFVAHARAALVEPVALCLAILALLAYVRLDNRSLAIPLSTALAFGAFCSKLYFLFTLSTIAGLWLLELVVVPAATRRRLEIRPILILVASLAAATACYSLYVYAFGERLADYYIINSDKAPLLDVKYMTDSLIGSLKLLSYNTKTSVFLLIILLSPAVVLAMMLWPRGRCGVARRIQNLGRAELSLVLWLTTGLLTVGLLQAHKPHYHFFAILPLCFIGCIGLKLVFPQYLHTTAVGAAAALHLLFQATLYHQWWQSPQHTAIVDSSREVARLVEQESDERMIPVIGEYAAQLGLYSERIFSLDVKWSPSYHYCKRMEFWKPRFHVNIVWPGSVSRQEVRAVKNCEVVADTTEIRRFSLFERRGDELVLSRIRYE